MGSIKLRRMVLVSFLLLPSGLVPQMPPQPARLIITSDPAGAIVTINGTAMGRRTNATFAVSPGSYAVTVSYTDPNHSEKSFSCPNDTVKVAAGATIRLNCTTAGWGN